MINFTRSLHTERDSSSACGAMEGEAPEFASFIEERDALGSGSPDAKEKEVPVKLSLQKNQKPIFGDTAKAGPDDDGDVSPRGVVQRRSVSQAPAPQDRQQIVEQVNAQLSEIPALNALAELMKVKPIFVAAAGALMCLGFVLYGFGGQMVCTLVGCLFPAFESFKAIEAKNSHLTSHWLNYWVVLACIATIEHLLYYVLVWVPFYYPMKLGFLMFLIAPQTDGANKAYRWMVRPMLSRNQHQIDKCITESKRGLRRTVTGTLGVGVNVTMAVGGDSVKSIRRTASTIAPMAARKVGGVATQLMFDVGSMRVTDMFNSKKGEGRSSVKISEVEEDEDFAVSSTTEPVAAN